MAAESSVATTVRAPSSGRLAILTGLSLAARTIPLPFVPDRVVARIRGAIAQDVASRFGLSLTSDARRILAAPSHESPLRDMLKGTLGFLSKTIFKKLSPFAVVLSASAAVETFALGHLFERYLDRHRGTKTVRVHHDEARELRRLIDMSLVRALSPSVKPEPVPLLPGVEDLRDEFTRWIDTVILAGASFPAYFERRLDAAFDQLVAEHGSPA